MLPEASETLCALPGGEKPTVRRTLESARWWSQLGRSVSRGSRPVRGSTGVQAASSFAGGQFSSRSIGRFITSSSVCRVCTMLLK